MLNWGVIMQLLKSILDQYLEREYFSGAVCTVIKDDDLVFEQSLGYTNINQSQKLLVRRFLI